MLKLVQFLTKMTNNKDRKQVMLTKIKNRLIEGYSTENDPFLYRRLVLTSALLSITLIAFTAFVFINYLKGHITLMVIDAVLILLSLISLHLLLVKKRNNQAAILATSMLFTFLIVLTYLTKSHDFSLVWTLCFPLFVIPILGTKRGLIMIALFYMVLVPFVASGIGVWENGAWNIASFVRFVMASSTVVFIAYFFESSSVAAYEAIMASREKEIKYLQKLENLSMTDQLTGLYNRRFFDEQFAKEIQRVNRYSLKLCVIMFDIDHFKSVNDQFGHQVGDSVLKEFSTLIQKIIRSSDTVFRWGGEEFIALLPETNIENATLIAEKLRSSIEQHTFEHIDKMTASFGVAAVNEQKESSTLTIKDADKALYLAKEQGRNRVVIASSQSQTDCQKLSA